MDRFRLALSATFLLLLGLIATLTAEPSTWVEQEVGYCRQPPMGHPERWVNHPFARPEETERDSAHGFNALRYDLQVRVDSAGLGFDGVLRFEFAVDDTPMNTITLMAQDLQIVSIRDTDFTPLVYDYDSIGATLVITPSMPLAPHSINIWTFTYRCIANDALNAGYLRYGSISYTMSEAFDGQRWMPSYNLPGDKAFYAVTVTVPPGKNVCANGSLGAIDTASDGWLSYHWSSRDSMCTYLMCFNWGDMAVLSDTAYPVGREPVPILYYVRPQDTARARVDFERTPLMIEFYSQTFGTFAFEKYGHTDVDTFAWGGMEHQTQTTLNANSITGHGWADGLVAHELAHMWWGDAVSPLEFKHIWLNESFATFSDLLWHEHYYGEETFRARRNVFRGYYFREFDGGIHYVITDPPVEWYFNAATYEKGGIVLDMLRREIGDSLFFLAMRNYYADHRLGHSTTEEWIAEINAVTPRDLNWFYNQWLFGLGHPVVHFAWSSDTSGFAGPVLNLHINQVQTVGESLFQIPITIRYKVDTTWYNADTVMTRRELNWQLSIAGLADSLQMDPDSNVLAEYAELSSVEMQFPRQHAQLRVVPNPLSGTGSIGYALPFGQMGKLHLLDILGHEIWSQPVQGNGEIRWPMDGELAAGLYQVVLQSGAGQIRTKVVVVR